MTLQTDKRDEELLEDIAQLFDIYASDSEACAARGLGSKRENLTRAKVWHEAASDVRSIKLTFRNIPAPRDLAKLDADLQGGPI